VESRAWTILSRKMEYSTRAGSLLAITSRKCYTRFSVSCSTTSKSMSLTLKIVHPVYRSTWQVLRHLRALRAPRTILNMHFPIKVKTMNTRGLLGFILHTSDHIPIMFSPQAPPEPMAIAPLPILKHMQMLSQILRTFEPKTMLRPRTSRAPLLLPKRLNRHIHRRLQHLGVSRRQQRDQLPSQDRISQRDTIMSLKS
jgi:hypothetical protein